MGAALLDHFVSGRCAELLNLPSRAPGHSVGSMPFPSFSGRPFNMGVIGHHHCLIVHPLTGATFSPALSHEALLLLHWTVSFAITLVPRFILGGKDRGCRFAEPSRPVHRLRVDLSSGDSRRVVGEVASVDLPLCHLSQILSPHVFLPLVCSHGSRAGCLSPILGQTP